MQRALHYLSWTLIVVAVIVILENINTETSVSLMGTLLPNMSLGGLLALVSAVLAIGSAYQYSNSEALRNQEHRRALRQAEKAEVAAETSSERVKALEQKIQTLETALQTALKRSAPR